MQGMLEPLELVVIAVILLVIFMFGPKKIPELAKSIGLARREFADASALASGKEPAPSSAVVNNSPTLPAIPARAIHSSTRPSDWASRRKGRVAKSCRVR